MFYRDVKQLYDVEPEDNYVYVDNSVDYINGVIYNNTWCPCYVGNIAKKEIECIEWYSRIDLERELSDKIGLKTSIHFNEGGSSGSLTLYYSDLNQLDEIMKRLKK